MIMAVSHSLMKWMALAGVLHRMVFFYIRYFGTVRYANVVKYSKIILKLFLGRKTFIINFVQYIYISRKPTVVVMWLRVASFFMLMSHHFQILSKYLLADGQNVAQWITTWGEYDQARLVRILPWLPTSFYERTAWLIPKNPMSFWFRHGTIACNKCGPREPQPTPLQQRRNLSDFPFYDDHACRMMTPFCCWRKRWNFIPRIKPQILTCWM